MVLGVNAWNEDKDTVARFVESGKLQHRILLNGGDVGRRYQLTGVPATFWIDPKGVIVDTESGFGFGSIRALENKTKNLLGK